MATTGDGKITPISQGEIKNLTMKHVEEIREKANNTDKPDLQARADIKAIDKFFDNENEKNNAGRKMWQDIDKLFVNKNAENNAGRKLWQDIISETAISGRNGNDDLESFLDNVNPKKTQMNTSYAKELAIKLFTNNAPEMGNNMVVNATIISPDKDLETVKRGVRIEVKGLIKNHGDIRDRENYKFEDNGRNVVLEIKPDLFNKVKMGIEKSQGKTAQMSL